MENNKARARRALLHGYQGDRPESTRCCFSARSPEPDTTNPGEAAWILLLERIATGWPSAGEGRRCAAACRLRQRITATLQFRSGPRSNEPVRSRHLILPRLPSSFRSMVISLHLQTV